MKKKIFLYLLFTLLGLVLIFLMIKHITWEGKIEYFTDKDCEELLFCISIDYKCVSAYIYEKDLFSERNYYMDVSFNEQKGYYMDNCYGNFSLDKKNGGKRE